MKILFCSSEVAPYCKTGGLGDVSASLPAALYRMGHEVKVIMPRYRQVGIERFGLQEVFSGFYRACAKNSPDVYFIDNKEFFDRDGIYGTAVSDYPDNFLRFSYFSRQLILALKELRFQPDIIHCNDWQTSLVPFFLRTAFRDDGFYSGIRTVLTVHNIGYQGIFPLSDMVSLGMNNASGELEDLKLWGKLNLLKGGIVLSDAVNTVSPTYANEVRSPRLGFGLEEFLRAKGNNFCGILNGVDYGIWNPESDPLIPVRYSAADMGGKKANKEFLIRKWGLKISAQMPLFALVSRLVSQKGIHLLLDAVSELVSLNAALIVLGKGEEKYERSLLSLAEKFSGRLAAGITFQEEAAHEIYAGADIFLMPSEYEPCGLSQMISMKYATLPLVFNTGGLSDTVKDGETGFVFQKYDSQSLISCLRLAAHTYAQPARWEEMMRGVMKIDFSWNKSAMEYADLYSRAMGV